MLGLGRCRQVPQLETPLLYLQPGSLKTETEGAGWGPGFCVIPMTWLRKIGFWKGPPSWPLAGAHAQKCQHARAPRELGAFLCLARWWLGPLQTWKQATMLVAALAELRKEGKWVGPEVDVDHEDDGSAHL